jgi:hypothetical protein
MADASRSWTWRHAVIKSDLPATTRHVLLTISCFMNEVGGGCYPTTLDLAAATGLSERAVCTHIAVAKEAGWLMVSEHGFRGQKWKNHQYHAAWPEPKGTERGSVASTEGTEPNDRKALNEVQCTSPVTTPISSNEDNRRATPLSELLAVLDKERAEAVIEHRKRIRKPMTAHAAKLLAGKFRKCTDPNVAADAMISNGWQGFEPAWLDQRRSPASAHSDTSKPRDVVEAARARLLELERDGEQHAIEHQH